MAKLSAQRVKTVSEPGLYGDGHGHTAHLASRMEQLADGGSILMAPATKRLVEGYVNLRPLGERTVKGLDRPVEVFEVLGVSAVRSRLLASVARGLIRCIGLPNRIDVGHSSPRIGRERSLAASRPAKATHWTRRAMANASGLSLLTLQRICAAHDLQPHQLRTFKRSNDPDFAAKRAAIIGL